MNAKVIITAENQTGPGIEAVRTSMAGLGVAIGAFSALAQNAISAMSELASQTIGLYKQQIGLADSMDEMSTRMGMSIKDLSAWKAAADMNGTSLEAMASGTRMLAKHMTEHGEALRKAGIDTKDTNKAFDQLSDLFKGMTDPVARLDLATRLFGRGLGQQLLPVLVMGSEGMVEIRETTDRYGEALTRLSPESQKLNDTLYLMGVEFKRAAAEGVFPLVKGFNDEMLPALREVSKEGSLLKTMWVGFGGAMKIGFADPWNQTLLGAKATLQQFMADVETMLAKITFGKVSELHLRESQRMAEAAKKTLAEAAGYAPKPHGVAPLLALPGENTDGEALALAASLRNSGRGGTGGKAAKTPLQRMIELGEKNLRESKQKEYQAADDDEEARLGAPKREMESLRLLDKEADAIEKLRQKYVAMADPLQQYRVQLGEINLLREKGVLSTEQAIEAEWAVNEAMDKAFDTMKNTGEAMKENSSFARDMGLSMTSAFENAVIGGQKASDVIRGLGQDIGRIMMRKAVTEPLGNAVSGFIKNIDFGNLFKAEGGPVMGGQSYIVGERGPEWFTPASSGTITPNHQLAAGGTTNHFTVDMRGASVEAVARLEQLVISVNGSIERRALNVMGQARVRGV